MKLVKFWLPVLVWAGVIFTFSSMKVSPASEIDWQDFFVKKLAHFIEYSVMYVLLYRAFINTTRIEKKKAFLITFVLVVIYAISDEIHQSFTPGREPKLRDVIIDTIAAFSALLLLCLYLPKAPKILKTLASNLDLI